MDSTDLQRIEHRARIRYEWARVWRAFLGFLPALLITAIAAALTRHPAWTLGFGAALFAAGVVLLWYGRDVRRAILPGLVMGLVPLAFALCASHLRHVCTGDGCMNLCVPACAAGGLAAGIGVAVIGHRRRHGVGYWVAASSIAVLTGAMGCACAGYPGLVGLAIGYAAGFAPMFVRRRVG